MSNKKLKDVTSPIRLLETVKYLDDAKVAQDTDIANKAGKGESNVFTEQNTFQKTWGTKTNELAMHESEYDIFTCRDTTVPQKKTALGKGYVWCQDSDTEYSQLKPQGIYFGNDTEGYEATLKFPTNISGEKTIATTDDVTQAISTAITTVLNTEV